jgi:hypothetical protein
LISIGKKKIVFYSKNFTKVTFQCFLYAILHLKSSNQNSVSSHYFPICTWFKIQLKWYFSLVQAFWFSQLRLMVLSLFSNICFILMLWVFEFWVLDEFIKKLYSTKSYRMSIIIMHCALWIKAHTVVESKAILWLCP